MAKKIVSIFILSIGTLLFIMSLSNKVNSIVSLFILSVPFINIAIGFIHDVLIAPWWNLMVLKPLMIVMITAIMLLLVQVASNFYVKRRIRFSRKITDRKTRAHMVINLKDFDGNVKKEVIK